MPADEDFNVIRFGFSEKERLANADGPAKVRHVIMLTIVLFDDGAGGNSFREVVHDEACKDFLADEIRFSSVKITQSYGIF